jgi:hypothetical protein
MTFTTIHSDMVMSFRLHTQFLTLDSSICIGCICSSISNVNDVCTISIWVIDRCVSTFRLCRRPHHLSSYHFDFNPAISVGGIHYGDDTQYTFSEKTTAHDKQHIDNTVMDIHSAISHLDTTVYANYSIVPADR